jgi:hypothetical protein
VTPEEILNFLTENRVDTHVLWEENNGDSENCYSVTLSTNVDGFESKGILKNVPSNIPLNTAIAFAIHELERAWKIWEDSDDHETN